MPNRTTASLLENPANSKGVEGKFEQHKCIYENSSEWLMCVHTTREVAAALHTKSKGNQWVRGWKGGVVTSRMTAGCTWLLGIVNERKL